ncbi:hypothetical protein, partial [Inquilinus sp. CA228]|uniref:hypothetical protein n=1 Tax=Inquilinus sp. CA228 TaxID=3455609 RepID=UPI003F8D4459
MADDIGDAAESLGISAEGLQEIRFAFSGAADAEQVDGAIARLGKTIGEASLGSKEAIKTFDDLGVSFRDGVTKQILPTDQVLRAVADRIAAIGSPAQQAALAVKLFGREAGTKLLPVLRQGAKGFDDAAARARAMGAIIGNQTVADAGALQQQLDELAVVVRAQLTAGFVEAGPQILAFTRLLADNLPMAVQSAAGLLKFLAENLKTLATVAAGLTGARLGAFIGSLAGSFLGPLGAVAGASIGAAAGAGAAYLAMGDDAESAAATTAQALGTLGTAEQQHLTALEKVRNVYAELKTASGERADALKAEADAIIDKATQEDLAAAQAELARRQAATAAARTDQQPVFDVMGNATGFTEGPGQREAEQAEAEQRAIVDAKIADIEKLKAVAAGTEAIFDPATAGVDELVDHLGQINGDQITQTQADMVSANQAIRDLVATVQGTPAEIQALSEQYGVLLADLASVTGWDIAGQSMANFIQGAQDIATQLREGQITTDQAAERYQHLLDLFGVNVSASQIVGEIGRIKDAMDQMAVRAASAWSTLTSKLGGVVARFVTGGGGQVVPDNAGVPRPRGTPPAPLVSAGGGGVTLPASGGGGGSKAKEPKDPKLPEFLKDLERETAALKLNSAAQKENELLIRATAIAKEDHMNKLRESAALTDAETAAIKRNAAAQAAVPDIVSMAGENLPQFGLDARLKELEVLKAALTDPAIVEALAAQGLTAADATKAIDLEMQKATDSAWGTAGAISAVGDAILTGAQAAGTLADKLMNVGLELAKLALQGLFGQGPLGGIFNQLLNVGAGGLMGLASVGSAAGGGVAAQGVMNGTGFRRSSASGNRLGGGMGTIMDELGQEAIKRGQDIFIPGSPATVMPATATRSAMADGLARGDMNLHLSVTGIGDKELLARVTAASQQAARQGIAAYDRKLMDRVDDQRMRVR